MPTYMPTNSEIIKLRKENAELKALWKKLIALDDMQWSNKTWIKYFNEWDKIKGLCCKNDTFATDF